MGRNESHAEIRVITEIDELQTFIGSKKNQLWIWTVVNHWKPGIILWAVGDRSSETFKRLWLIVKCWHSFWYVSDGYPVYPCFTEPEDHLVSKIYMTRVEGENTRLRHYLGGAYAPDRCGATALSRIRVRIASKDFVLFKIGRW